MAMRDDFFNGKQYKRLKLTPDLLEKNILDIIVNKEPRQITISYQHQGNQMQPIAIPILEFPFPTVEPLKDLDGTMSIETVTEVMGFIILELSPHWSKIYNGNGNNDNDGLTDQYAESLNRANRGTIPDLEQEIAEIPDRNYPEFIINTVKKEVKRDDVLIRQVLYTGLSAYTFDPQNLAIIGPTSEGKTYTTEMVMQYFPKDDVWSIGSISDKALIRQKGILINSKGESIQKQVDELKEKLRNITTAEVRLTFAPPDPEKDRQENEPKMTLQDKVNKKRAEIKKELNTLLDDASTLIYLQGKILVFLEPPGKGVLNLIKPILSHDKEEISYPYTAKNENSGEWVTRNVIVRGWQLVYFAVLKIYQNGTHGQKFKAGF